MLDTPTEKPIHLSTTLYMEYAKAMEKGDKTEEFRQATPYWRKILQPLIEVKRPMQIHFIVGPWWWDFEVKSVEYTDDLIADDENGKSDNYGPYYILNIGKMLGKHGPPKKH